MIRMKNVFIVPAITFGFLIGTQTISAQSKATNDTATVISQVKYVEVAIDKLPQPVLDAVSKDYKKSTINKVAAKEDNSEFRLQLTKENGETVELYCDANGKWAPKK